MARETAAAKQARFEAELQLEQAKKKMAFPGNLQVALQAASEFGFKTEFANGKLNVMNRDTREVFEFELTVTASTALQIDWTEDNQKELYQLEYDVEFLAEERRERERKQALRDGALAKLTDAERAVLGL